MTEILFDIGLVIVLATALAFVAKFLKQSLIIAFIAAGILIGPSGFGMIRNENVILALSEFGIAFLLFIIGLELDFRKLKELGKPTLLTSVFQMSIAFIAGFSIGKLFLFSNIPSIYLGIAVSFASTTVVLKLLSDKNEIYTMHGRFQLGILLVEDVFAVFALALLTTLDSINFSNLMLTLGKGLLLFIIAALAGRFIFPRLLENAAKNQELLFLSAISLSFVMAYLSLMMNFSVAMGAFLAGISIAALPYSYEIVGRMKSLRDFFATIFFVALGMQITFSSITLVKPILGILFVVVILTPIVVMISIALFGYGKKIAFLSGIALSQMSEFALVIAAQGVVLGHITKNTLSLIAIVTVISIIISSYFIKYDQEIFNLFSKKLRFLDRFKRKEMDDYTPLEKYDYILIGCDRIGYSVLETFKKMNQSFVIIDYNPEIIKHMKKEKIPCIYGDVADFEILDKVKVHHARMVISTIPNRFENTYLIKEIRKENKKSIIIVTARNIDDALYFYDLGADYVIVPHFLGGDYVSLLLEYFTEDFARILYQKVQHMDQLRKRKESYKVEFKHRNQLF
jgi:Kef-type K+ transport system membrane component KefB/voltage-gated potassium channel Kch